MWYNIMEMKDVVVKFKEYVEKNHLESQTVFLKTTNQEFILSFYGEQQTKLYDFHLSYDFDRQLLWMDAKKPWSEEQITFGTKFVVAFYIYCLEQNIDVLVKTPFHEGEFLAFVKRERAKGEMFIPTGANSTHVLSLYESFPLAQSFSSPDRVHLLTDLFSRDLVEIRHEVHPTPKIRFEYTSKEEGNNTISLFEVRSNSEKEQCLQWFSTRSEDVTALKALLQEAPETVQKTANIYYGIRGASYGFIVNVCGTKRFFEKKEEAAAFILLQTHAFCDFLSMIEKLKSFLKERDPDFVALDRHNEISVNYYRIKCFFAGKIRDLDFYYECKSDDTLSVCLRSESKFSSADFDSFFEEAKERFENLYTSCRLKNLYEERHLRKIPWLLHQFGLFHTIGEHTSLQHYPIATRLTYEEIHVFLQDLCNDDIVTTPETIIEIGGLYLFCYEDTLYIEKNSEDLSRYYAIRDKVKKKIV